jgi:hypothetical protein
MKLAPLKSWIFLLLQGYFISATASEAKPKACEEFLAKFSELSAVSTLSEAHSCFDSLAITSEEKKTRFEQLKALFKK